MAESDLDYLDKNVHPTEWAVILGDWKRSDAWVTVYLRTGATLGPGKVTRLPTQALDSAEISTRSRHTPEKRWTFDLNEVAAITAEASS